jgi:hypothetical protein
LAGLVHTCGALTIGRGRGALFNQTLAVGKLIVSLADALYSLETTIELSEREAATAHARNACRRRRGKLFSIRAAHQRIRRFSIGETVPARLLTDDEPARVPARRFFRQRFLHESLSRVSSGIVARSEAFAEQLLYTFRVRAEAKTMLRREKPIVYLKATMSPRFSRSSAQRFRAQI